MVRLRALLSVACACLLLAGCGGGGGHAAGSASTATTHSYPVGPWLYFTASCEEAMASTTCDCVIRHLEATEPVSRLREAEAAVRSRGSAVPGWLEGPIRACGA